jgi:hypothetical protein
MFRNLFVGAAMIAATGLIIYAGSARAEPIRAHGIICQSQTAEESAYAFADANLEASMSDAVKATNEVLGKEDCALKTVIYEEAEKVGEAKRGDMDVEIRKLKVYAECQAGFCLYLGEKTAFGAFVVQRGPKV